MQEQFNQIREILETIFKDTRIELKDINEIESCIENLANKIDCQF